MDPDHGEHDLDDQKDLIITGTVISVIQLDAGKILSSMEWINKLKPGTPKNWLLLTAGLIWTAVGILLVSLALGWILQPAVDSGWIYLVSGFGLAYLIYKFGFSRLAAKNNQRIKDLPVEKPCLFAFQEWHSYPLVLLMIGLGITLRKFTPIPKPLLGILYIGIGGGLGGSSLIYYRQILQNIKIRQSRP